MMTDVPATRRPAWPWLVGGLLLVMLLVQVVTYSLWARERMPFALLQSLDHPVVEFYVLEEGSWQSLSEGQQQRLRQELTAAGQTLYLSREEVPGERYETRPFTPEEIAEREAIYEQAKEAGNVSAERLEAMRAETEAGIYVLGFRSGMSLGWRIEGEGLFWMQGSAHSWMGNTGAEWRTDLYVWMLWRWVRVRNIRQAIS